MSFVTESVRMSVNDHYRIVSEMEDRFQEVIDSLYDRIGQDKEMYRELLHAKWKVEDELSKLKREMGK